MRSLRSTAVRKPASLPDMPCIVRNMTDDEAVLAMTDDNMRHREKILPTEKANSLKMQVEAIKHQGGPGLGEDAGKCSTEIVGARKWSLPGLSLIRLSKT